MSSSGCTLRWVLLRSQGLLAAASRVLPSNKGFITVSEDGDEMPANLSGVKRVRGRPRKTASELVEVEVVAERPTKKPRGRSKKEKDIVEVEVEMISPVPKKWGRLKQSEAKDDEDTGAEAELEDDTTPVSKAPVSHAEDQVPHSRRSHASMTSVSPEPGPSAPPSSRDRFAKPSSSAIASEIRTPSEANVSKPKRQTEPVIEVTDGLKEESEKEDELPKKTSKIKTPRRSTGEDSGFSDYNPFQSGSEDAAQRDRRRRKVS